MAGTRLSLYQNCILYRINNLLLISFRELTSKTESFGYLLENSSSPSSSSSNSSHHLVPSGPSSPANIPISSTSSSSLSTISSESSEEIDPFDKYDPDFLDDPELRAGRHCTMIALAGYYSSLSHYVPAEQLKEELNTQFYARHSHHIHPSITLTKIRSLKALLIDVALECELELSCVAMAFVYLEKLLLAKIVTRSNRKLVASCSLLLAVKVLHDPKDTSARVISALSRQFGESKAAILRMEFRVFAGLRFCLHLPQHDYVPHLERILIDLPFSNIHEYLGERMYQMWKQKK